MKQAPLLFLFLPFQVFSQAAMSQECDTGLICALSVHHLPKRVIPLLTSGSYKNTLIALNLRQEVPEFRV